MTKNLVIVESPAKAKTIARFLGKDFEVKSSFGHIRDLPKKELGVNIEKDFEPSYQISPDKSEVVKELKKAAKDSVVWLASDEDREGEAIAWHISVALGLKPEQAKRIVFHEITEPAIRAAVAKPRTIDLKLVEAQQARRVLDRLVGYELSPVLWRKVRAGLSAGRVQSVAVRLVVEREREIKVFIPESTFRVSAGFVVDGQELPAELDRKLSSPELVKDFLLGVRNAKFHVQQVDQKPGNRSPSAPFTTSTLQQEASRRLGFSVRQTMSLAQKLYENGLITYMRTDSTSLSNLAVDAARKYIVTNFGDQYSQSRQYKTKSSTAQEAHEAIRPTDMSKSSAGADSGQKKLYELIWRRAVASQMAPASIQKTEVLIGIEEREEKFVAKGEVLTFDGFYKVYGGNKDDVTLPRVEKDQEVSLEQLGAVETFSRPPSRYSEASLVKKLEELGIGRPSTYAPTISTIQDRGYVEKKDLEGKERTVRIINLKDDRIDEQSETVMTGTDKAKLVPTELAQVVTDFLLKFFPDIIDYDFTARAEQELDAIAEGKLSWKEMLDKFYKALHPLVEKSRQASRSEAVKARELGVDPKSGQKVFVRFGRYGPVLQLGEIEEGKTEKNGPKPKFASLPAGSTLEDITLEQALPMFNLPRRVGETPEGDEIISDIGRFGPYVKVGKTYVSIKDHDPLTITQEEAIRLIKNKVKTEAERVIADFGKVKVLRGPYGPYVTDGKKNARVPKEQKPEDIDETEAKALLDQAKPGAKRFKRRTKKA